MSKEQHQPNNSMTIKIIWFALLSSQNVFLLVISQIKPQNISDPDDTMTAMYFGMGIMAILFGLFGVPKVFKGSPFQTIKILQWAFIEVNMVLALISSQEGTSMTVVLGSYVLSMLGMVLTFPRNTAA